VNRIMALIGSATTASLRFKSEVNATLDEIVTNLKPMPAFKFCTMAVSPIRPFSEGAQETFTPKELISELFDDRNCLCDTGYNDGSGASLKTNRFLACALILRGHEADPSVPGGKRPISVSAIQGAINNLINPTHSQGGIKFASYYKKGFKIGDVASTPMAIPGFIAPTDRQGCLLANSTVVRTMFMRQYKKFLALNFHRAFHWQYISAGGTEDDFMEAKDLFRDIIDSYEQVLIDSCDVQNSESSVPNAYSVVGGFTKDGFRVSDEHRATTRAAENMLRNAGISTDPARGTEEHVQVEN